MYGYVCNAIKNYEQFNSTYQDFKFLNNIKNKYECGCKKYH